MCIDIKTIKASRLITEIEQAFRVWKENVYTRNYSFETFCDYILPYRQETVCWWIVHARYSTVGITDSFLPIPEKYDRRSGFSVTIV